MLQQMALRSLSQRQLEVMIQSQNMNEHIQVAEYTFCQHSWVLVSYMG